MLVKISNCVIYLQEYVCKTQLNRVNTILYQKEQQKK